MEPADNTAAYVSAYEARHVIPHLLANRRYNDAHRILNLSTTQHTHAWYTAREAAGEVSSFLADIDAMWRAIDRESVDPSAAPAPAATHLTWPIRYALIASSVNSLARNLPTDLIDSLLDSGVWSIAQALAYARQMPFPQQQAETLLAVSTHIPAGERSTVLEEALAAAWRIRGTRSPVTVVAQIAQFMPPASKAAVWQQIFTVASTTGLSVAKADAFVALAPYIPEDMVDGFLAEAADLTKPFRRAQAFLGLVPYAPWRRQEILEAIVSVARQIDNEEMCSEIVAGVAPLLSPDLLPELQTLTRQIRSTAARTMALAGLAPFLPDPAADETVEYTLGMIPRIKDDLLRATALIRLIPNLASSQLPRVPEIIESLTKQETKAQCIAQIAPLLPSESIEAVYALALHLSEDRFKAPALGGLIPFLPEQRQRELAATLAEHLAAGAAQSVVLYRLARLAPHSQKRALSQQALSAAQLIDDIDAQAYALNCVIRHFPVMPQEATLNNALSRVRQIHAPEVRFDRLLDLVYVLSLDQQRELIAELRSLVDAFTDPAKQTQAFVQLLPWMEDVEATQWLDNTLAALGRVPKEARRVILMERIIGELPRLTGQEVLSLARAIVNPYWRARAVLAIADHPGPIIDTSALATELFALVQSIPNEKQKSDALARSARLLSQYDRLDLAIAEAHTLTSLWRKEQALTHLIPELARCGFMSRAQAAAGALQYVACRGEALAGCLRFADAESRPALVKELQPIIEEILTRDPQAATLARLLPLLAECGLPHLALRVAPWVKDFALQARGLTAAIPLLPQESLNELSPIIAAIEDNRWKMVTLLVLLPHLRSEQKRQEIALEVLGLALSLDSLDTRPAALRDLAPHLLALPADLRVKSLRDFLHLSARRTRADLLSDIGSLVAVFGAAGAASIAWELHQMIVEVTTWWP